MIGYLQIGRAVPTTAWELITHATTITKIVLVILLILSLLSWAIMVLKWREFRRTAQASKAMWRELEHVARMDELRALQRRAVPGPFTNILARALTFLDMLRTNARSGLATGGHAGHAVHPGHPAAAIASEPIGAFSAAPLTGSQVEALRLVLDAETVEERGKLGRYIPTLAVVGSASPLLGLLGTVIGVISAFLGIATQGSGNLSAVAPGVAEALIATAAALSVAIPAVFGYNIFASRLNRIDGELEAFGTEIIALLVREGQI